MHLFSLKNAYIIIFREWYTEKLSNGKPIIIYMHGNTGSRAREHRLNIYHIFQDLDYHTICFDYRGNKKLVIVEIIQKGFSFR